MTRFTRRRLLATMGVGGVGIATVVPTRATASTHYTYAQISDDEGRVKVAWFETYNGELQEHQGVDDTVTEAEALDSQTDPTYVPDVDGPVLTLGNILPGDRGRLAIGIELADPPAESGPFAIDLRAANVGTDAGALTEPERKAPPGHLAEAMEAALWRDGPLSPCDGTRSFFDPPVGDGTLGDVLSILANDGIRVCTDCFDVAPQHYCFGLAWELPAETGNAVQGDTVEFDLEVVVHDNLEGGT
ncbi:MAG: hypothetical protein ABEH64_08240 [Salinirussus sp.]